MSRSPRVAVLTVSDRSYLALREDQTGPAIVDWARQRGWEILGHEVLSDDAGPIHEALLRWIDTEGADLVLTTGGTGLSPRDHVPEATLRAAERVVPGIPEWIRGVTAARNPHAALSRGTAVLRGRALIVNLPGSPRAVAEYLELLGRILPHALEQAAQRQAWGDSDAHPEALP